jgi:LSU ribosomal protein L22P
MGKPKRERTLADNEAQAVTRNLRVSPQKLNLVAAMIRGKKVNSAWPISPSRASVSPAM